MSRLHAGTAVTEMDIDEGVQLSGYGVEERGMTGVHDPLMIKSVVLSSGGETVAIVSLDVLNVYRELTRRVRRRLAAPDLGIDELLLVATHTHAGPYLPADTLEINPNHRMETDRDAIGGIEDGIVSTVRTAHERLEPARLRVGRAENDTTAVNRRAEGGVSGTIRMPRGEIDPELVVVDIETGSGEETILFNYACHPVCTTSDKTEASADWPGYACREVAEREDAVVVFLNGAAGDINPRDWPADPNRGAAVYEFMEAVGTEVAATVEEALQTAREGRDRSTAPLIADSRDLSLPMKDVPAESALERRIDELDEKIRRLEDDDGNEAAIHALRADRSYVEELLGISRWGANRIPCTMQYVELADIGILGMPGEVFAEHGLGFKSRASVDTLLPVGYANDYVGYLPTLAELENVDYEVRTMKVAPEAIVQFRECAFNLVSTGP